jgi:hypothetical protein
LYAYAAVALAVEEVRRAVDQSLLRIRCGRHRCPTTRLVN